MNSVIHWKMSKIIILLIVIVGLISFVQAAPSAEPCVIILPPPRPSATVTPVTSVTTSAPTATGIPTATSAPASVPSGPPALTPEQLATLMELYNMYMEFLKSQNSGTAAPPALPLP